MPYLKRLIPAVLMLLAMQLAACRTLPFNDKLPENLAIEKIAGSDENSPFAFAPDGSSVALARSGLKLFHMPRKAYVQLSSNTPRKLAWSPFDNAIAALFREEQKSRVIVYDHNGTPLAETVIDAPLTDLGWIGKNELALGGTVIKEYKFGSNYRSILFRWQPGMNAPVASELRDSTLQPNTVKKWRNFLKRGPLMDFSGQTPLISYLHPVEPPLFPPYYKLIIKDLASGREIEVAPVGLSTDGARLSADGELILFGDGYGATVLRNPWSEELLAGGDSPGSNLALAAGGSWFADGALYRKGALPTPLAPGAAAAFSADGSRLLLQTGSELFLLIGLKPVAEAMINPALNTKIQQLRTLRAGGLISPPEYRESLERILHQ
jgi:hypothetical protein